MRKVQLTIKQEEVAPATTSDLVVMNNGKTLKEELSTSRSDQFSSESTVTTSMEKVVDGAYSGVYEHGVMYGRSLVNLVSNHKIEIANGTTNSFPMTIPMDVGKKYLISFKIDTAHTSTGESNQSAIKLQYYSSTNSKGYNFIYNSELADGREFKFIVEPFSGEVNQNTNFFAIWLTRYESGTLRGKLSVFEYVDGMENWDIPYFDGLCDVKMPILRNVGKNLLDPQTFIPLDKGVEYVRYENGYVLANFTNANTHFFYKVDLARLPKGMYTVIAKHEGERSYLGIQHTFKDGTKTWGKTQFNNDGSYAELGLYMQSTTNDPSLKVKAKIMLVANGDTTSPYEDYKSNILHTPEAVTLRSLPNGVRDELNVMTGEYIKRIGEIVFDGSQDASKWGTANYENENFIQFYWEDRNVATDQTGGNISVTCNKFPTYSANNLISTNPQKIGVCTRRQGKQGIVFSVTTDDVSTFNRTSITTYFTNNPTVVQYELAEPMTTIVEPLTIPFAYENGHIILESGSEEQSLLPELKYSVPASKSGVISTTSNTILKHEQRLHKFEDLLLRESILMDYRLTLSFLDKM